MNDLLRLRGERGHAGSGFTGLRRSIVLVLLLKLAALGLIYLCFFSGPHQPRIDGSAVARHFDPARRTP
jgi:hypothetical protein